VAAALAAAEATLPAEGIALAAAAACAGNGAGINGVPRAAPATRAASVKLVTLAGAASAGTEALAGSGGGLPISGKAVAPELPAAGCFAE
jgi:hypothetical protein